MREFRDNEEFSYESINLNRAHNMIIRQLIRQENNEEKSVKWFCIKSMQDLYEGLCKLTSKFSIEVGLP